MRPSSELLRRTAYLQRTDSTERWVRKSASTMTLAK